MTITIFHTGDLHNRLTPTAARKLVELRRERPGSLLLDAGDAVAAGNLTYRMLGEPILRAMADVGYQAMAMGNRESHPLRSGLERKLRDASFPVLAANIRNRRRVESSERSRFPNAGRRSFEGPEVVRSHVVLSTPYGRVAVIGFAPEMVRPTSLWARLTDYVFEDPMEVVPELASRLRGEADIVVCLSHAGEGTNRALAALPEVDVVLAGHSHRAAVVAEPGFALIAYAGHHGSHVVKTELTGRADARCELIALGTGR